jgi:hypothetical protein
MGEGLQSAVDLDESIMIFCETQPGAGFLKVATSKVSLSTLGGEDTQRAQSMRYARTIADFSADVQRLIEVLEDLVRRSALPQYASQSLVDA